MLCRYIAIASDRGGTDSPLSGPAKLFGKGQRKQDLQSRISPMSHPSNQSSPTSKDSITFFSLPPIQLRPSLLRPEGSDGKTPAAAQGVLVSSPMDPSNCSPVVAGRQAEAQFFTPLNTEADVGRPVAVDVFVSSALRPEGTPFFTPVSGEEGESKDKQKALQSREEMAGGKERASPHGGRPTEEPQMQTIPETSPAKEKGIQGLSSGATEGSETADGTKGQEGRKEVRQTRPRCCDEPCVPFLPAWLLRSYLLSPFSYLSLRSENRLDM